MTNFKEELRKILPKSSKDFVNFGRSLKARYSHLYCEVMRHTTFLENCRFVEHLYCYMNNLYEIPKCPISGKNLEFRYYASGYARFHSSVKPTDFTNYSPNEYFSLTEDDIGRLRSLYNESDKHLLSNKLLGNFPHLVDAIVGATIHLNPCCFNERIFCIINNTTRSAGYKWVNGVYVENDVMKKHLEERDARHEALAYKYFNVKDSKYGSLIESAIKKSSQDEELMSYDESEEGISFVKCPVIGIRMRSMTVPYMKSILKMTKDEFSLKFPNYETYCSVSKDRIKEGLQVVGEDGRTAHRKGIDAAMITKTTVGEDGLTPNQKIGINSKNTHMSNIDEHGRNGYSQLAAKAIIKGNKTKVEKGLITSEECRTDYYKYKQMVISLTSDHVAKKTAMYKTGRANDPDAYQLDHRYSIMHGFRDGVSPFLIGSASNLEMIPAIDNIRKYTRSSISLDELMKCENYSIEKSRREFEITMMILNETESLRDSGVALTLKRIKNAILQK